MDYQGSLSLIVRLCLLCLDYKSRESDYESTKDCQLLICCDHESPERTIGRLGWK